MQIRFYGRLLYSLSRLAPCSALVLTSCTIVQIEGANKARFAGIGALRIEPKPGAKAMIYQSRGFGLVPGNNGATLGYATETTALVYDPGACHLIILKLPENAAALADWRALLATHPDICAIGDNEDALEGN